MMSSIPKTRKWTTTTQSRQDYYEPPPFRNEGLGHRQKNEL